MGDPDPDVTWRSPGGYEVKGSGAGYELVDGVLTIIAVTNQKDGGMWTCVACNLLGCDTANTHFGVEGNLSCRFSFLKQEIGGILLHNVNFNNMGSYLQ